MNKQELTQIRKQLYKTTPLKLQLVDEIINNIKSLKVNGLRFDTTLKLEGIQVELIEIDPQEIGGILIHWLPNHHISTKQDPYCSVYMLQTNTIKKLLRIITKTKQNILINI